MSRPKTEELQKHTLNLREGDVDTIAELFPNKSPTVIIRKIVSKFVDSCLAGQEERKVSVPNINLES